MEDIIIFRLDNEYYGLAVDNVVEIIRKVRINQVPIGGQQCLGLLDIRGKISNVYDLSGFLGIKTENIDYFIVCKNEDEQIIFPITEVIEITKLQNCEKMEQNIKHFVSDNVSSVIKSKDRLILMLNYELIIDDIKKWQAT